MGRLFNIILASALLLLSIPLWLMLYCLVVATSKGGFLFKQKRTGKNNTVFTIYKIRTMVKNAEQLQKVYLHLNESDGPTFKIRNDPRFTQVGRWISWLGLDEMPQLINVLKGDMDLVGPRPLPVYEAKKIPKQYRQRFLVKPGITSDWVIRGRYNLTFHQWMRLDLAYIQKKSIPYDLKVLMKTLLLVFRLIFRNYFVK